MDDADPPIIHDPNDEWHVSVDLMLTIDCDSCYNRFISPTLGKIVYSGDDAALAAAEAQSAGGVLAAVSRFRCPDCAGIAAGAVNSP